VVDRYVTPGLDAPVKLEFLGEIPSDPAVREAVARRQLLLECFPAARPLKRWWLPPPA
jgi:flagellar biosynthesis protein FlhG